MSPGETTSGRPAGQEAQLRRKRAAPGTRAYGANGVTGLVRRTRARSTSHLVGLYHAQQSGIEMDPETPWVTVCEEHGSCVCHQSLALARQWTAEPETWCEKCQKEMEEKTT